MTLKRGLTPGILVSLLSLGTPTTAAEQGFEHFVRREGDTLKDGDRAFRFIFKAYHWPGFAIGEPYDERRLLHLLRDRAHGIRGTFVLPDQSAPPLPRPAPPHLLKVSDGALLTWRGSTGADDYQIERSRETRGPWQVIATGVSDAQVQYHPLYSDETAYPHFSYFYRVVARNAAGASDPSNDVGPVTIDHHTLVDELWNDSRILLRQGMLTFRQNDARKFKEDCHRLAGEPGSAVVYHAANGIRKVRAFAFSRSNQPELAFSVSFDGRSFQQVNPSLESPAPPGDKDAYGSWNPLIYKVDLEPAHPGTPFLRIEFRGQTQIGRIEVEYGDSDRG
jgi:mannan endo-1,4-beta-mannosidase